MRDRGRQCSAGREQRKTRVKNTERTILNGVLIRIKIVTQNPTKVRERRILLLIRKGKNIIDLNCSVLVLKREEENQKKI